MAKEDFKMNEQDNKEVGYIPIEDNEVKDSKIKNKGKKKLD